MKNSFYSVAELEITEYDLEGMEDKDTLTLANAPTWAVRGMVCCGGIQYYESITDYETALNQI